MRPKVLLALFAGKVKSGGKCGGLSRFFTIDIVSVQVPECGYEDQISNGTSNGQRRAGSFGILPNMAGQSHSFHFRYRSFPCPDNRRHNTDLLSIPVFLSEH